MPPLHPPKPTKISSPPIFLSTPHPRLRHPSRKPHTIVPIHNHTPHRSQHHHSTSRPNPRLLHPTIPPHRLRNFSYPPIPSTHRLLSTTTSPTPTPPPAKEPTPLSTTQYHALSDAHIDALLAVLEAMQEEREDVDVEYSVRYPPPSPLPLCALVRTQNQ